MAQDGNFYKAIVWTKGRDLLGGIIEHRSSKVIDFDIGKKMCSNNLQLISIAYDCIKGLYPESEIIKFDATSGETKIEFISDVGDL